MRIVELRESDRPAWDAYVEKSQNGMPQHLSGWRNILNDIYGYETEFMMAKEANEVVGVFPLFCVRSVLTGNTLTSMPGGLCTDDPSVAKALTARGLEIARKKKVNSLVLQDTREVWPGSLETNTFHQYTMVDTSRELEKIWFSLHRETRRQVRVARKNNLHVQIDRNGAYVDEFHTILSRFVHKAGTPVFGREFLEKVVATFPGKHSIAIVYQDNEPLGGYLQMMKGDTVYGIWGATLQEHLHLRATYLGYWEILSDAADHGYQFWDMGRSPAQSNVGKFKEKWNGISMPVYQQVGNLKKSKNNKSIVGRVQAGGNFRRFMRVWPKLPFPLVQFIGPRLRRHVPFA